MTGQVVHGGASTQTGGAEESLARYTLLANHREVVAVIDCLTVPTATFRVLYAFFVIHHARRMLIHVRVT